MFDASFWEFFLVFVIALLVLGPERLPRVAHTTGLWLGRARNAMRRLQREIQREFLIEETRQAVEKARSAVDSQPFDDGPRPAADTPPSEKPSGDN